ncbi:hypothetical protein [Marinospirillum insulare]|uniref:Uncharacterized protein n=1 Tax=Marinospirillum insulare TaxID=217169 RepID=A0ABQ5ZYW4_9GAMM|nr:hypothetical protein [Marinospirillum insulare]GLR65179.1 hypothetical protein GCM10007878_26180 [Marinospirillum insulare]
MLTRLLTIFLASFLLAGCSGLVNKLVPDVYLVDRHTLMEADSAGEWPELENRLMQSAIKDASEPYAGIDEQLDEQEGFRALNAEYTAPTSQKNN